jgi:FAD/FMN-containing dehydrogenase
LAQNGGHGFNDAFHLGQNGVLINLRALNGIFFNAARTEAVVQGGALISEVIDAAWVNNAQLLTGNCNCVGTLGAALGGGYGNLMGLYGLSIDNILALNTVLADGRLVTVTPRDADLWWALRGAGPNFGIVTSAVYKSYPVPQAQNKAWRGGLLFTDDKVEAVTQAIEELKLEPKMSLLLLFVTSGPPESAPLIIVQVFYYGSAVEGKKAFASVYAIGPYADTTAETPYNRWNAPSDVFCLKGERKPSYGVGFSRMVPATMHFIWNQYTAFVKHSGTGNSAILVEAYPLEKAQSLGSASSSFPGRDIRFNGIAIAWYPGRSLDQAAEAFGSSVRDALRAVDGFSQNRT